MAFLSCVSCVPSLSFSILVVAIIICVSFPISDTQGIVVLGSPSRRSIEFRPTSENKSVVNVNKTPENMQLRRFMWKEVDETMDDIIQGVANGAIVMKGMIDSAFLDTSKSARYQRHTEHSRPIAANLKYVLKNPPLKTTRIIKVTPSIPKIIPSIPKKIVNIIPVNPLVHIESIIKPVATTTVSAEINHLDTSDFKIDEKTLRDIEKKEEEKVEATISSVLPNVNHHEEIIIGKYNSDWQPVIVDTNVSYSTKKPHIVSQLHTNVLDVPFNKTEINEDENYEVTENTAEETIQRPHTSRPDNEKSNRRKGTVQQTEYRNGLQYLKTHKQIDLSTTESSLPISKPKIISDRSSRKVKIRIQNTVEHSTRKPRMIISSKRDIGIKLLSTTTEKSNREKIESSKIDNSTKQTPILTKLLNTRGSVKFGSKV